MIINAIMLGLTRQQARERFDEIIAFAELEEFLDLKLKNYSSGMSVRLAFSVAIQVDADVLLIDEVLAVGDAAFQQKCFEQFHRAQGATGKTIVFVTHDMSAVERFCDRAMLLERGRDASRSASRARSRAPTTSSTSAAWSTRDAERRRRATATTRREIVDAWFEDAGGERVSESPQGEPLHDVHARSRFHGAIERPDLRASTCATRPATRLRDATDVRRRAEPGSFAAGERVDRAGRASTTGSRRAATRSRRRSRAPARGADALDLREDLASLVVHGTRATRRRRRPPARARRGARRERGTVERQRPRVLGARRRGASGSLTWTLAVTDWKLRFYGSVLGYVWTLARPFAVLRRHLLRLHRDRRARRRASRTTASTSCSRSCSSSSSREVDGGCVQSLVARENLLRKMRFPRLVIPLSVVLTALFNLGMTLIAVFIFAIAAGVYPTLGWLELPVLVALLAVFATGHRACCCRALFVRYRDIQPIWEVVAQMLFYASPVLYVATMVPENYQRAVPASTRSPRCSRRCATRSSTRRAPTAADADRRHRLAADPARRSSSSWSRSASWVFSREAPRIAENLVARARNSRPVRARSAPRPSAESSPRDRRRRTRSSARQLDRPRHPPAPRPPLVARAPARPPAAPLDVARSSSPREPSLALGEHLEPVSTSVDSPATPGSAPSDASATRYSGSRRTGHAASPRRRARPAR